MPRKPRNSTKAKGSQPSTHTSTVNRGQDVPGAVYAVLAVKELLECILHALPCQKLFVIQRVCKDWRDTVQESSVLQQKMFLLPVGAPLTPNFPLPVDFDDPDCDIHATYLTTDISFSPFTTLLRVQCETEDGGDRVPDQADNDFDVSAHASETVALNIFPDYKEDIPDIGILASRGRFAPNASWTQTLLSQPPVTAVTVEYEDWREGGIYGFTAANCRGLTLGDVYQAAQHGKQSFYMTPGKSSFGMSGRMMLRLDDRRDDGRGPG